MQQLAAIDRDRYATVLTIERPLTSENAATNQADLLADVQAADAGPVLLDLTGHQSIDSMSISLLIGLWKACEQRDWQLTIAIDHPFIAKVVGVMHLERHLDFVRIGDG